MQTFLPYADFTESAKVLDYRRLGKQRVETKQILNTLFHGGGWARHPAVQMWKGHERALCHYGIAICDEWVSRGYSDYCRKYFTDILGAGIDFPYARPWWIGDDLFHQSHRSNLLRKDLGHYRQFWPELSPSIPYRWPTSQPGHFRVI